MPDQNQPPPNETGGAEEVMKITRTTVAEPGEDTQQEDGE